MEVLLTIILVAVGIFYLLGFIGRMVLRYWVRRKQREFSEQFGGSPFGQAGGFGQQSSRQRQQKKKPEGEVSVQQTRKVEKRVSKDVGDYVDYEDVEIEN